MGDPSKKVTSIFVIGDRKNIESIEKRDMAKAKSVLGSRVQSIALSDRTESNFIHHSPVTVNSFYRIAGRTVRHHGHEGMLIFNQYGHGDKGPGMMTTDGNVVGSELVNFFANNVQVRGNERPYTAVLMGGCYSGGFGELFLRNPKFKPDFFLGASPPFSINHVGLRKFYEATLKNADYNKDGVLTLRERAVYQMNNSRDPWAVMYARSGSPDVDIHGKKAKKPHFRKRVKRIRSHRRLVREIKNLRLGEQAIVLIKGRRSSRALYRKFKRQARNGDGFYKFIVVNYNRKSAAYFGTGKKDAVIAMGLNLVRKGVRLTTSKPLAAQMPKVIATQDLLQVIRSWPRKYAHYSSKDSILSYILKNPHYKRQGLVKKATRLVRSGKSADILTGLKTLLIVFQNSAYRGRFGDINGPAMKAVLSLAKSTLKSRAKPSPALLIPLVKILQLSKKPAAVSLRVKLNNRGVKLYPKQFAKLLQGQTDLKGFAPQWRKALRSPDQNIVANALSLIRDADVKLTKGDYAHLFTKVLSSSNVSARRLAGTMLVKSKKKYAIQLLIKRFKVETDDITRTHLATLLLPYAKSLDVQRLDSLFKTVATQTNHASLRTEVKKLIASIAEEKAWKHWTKVKIKMQRKMILQWRTELGFLLGATLRSDGKRNHTGGISGSFFWSVAKGIYLDDKRENLLTLGFYGIVEGFRAHWKQGWYTISPIIGGLTLEWLKLKDAKSKIKDVMGFFNPDVSTTLAFRPGYAVSYTPARDDRHVDHGPALSLGYTIDVSRYTHSSMGLELTSIYYLNRREFSVTLNFRMGWYHMISGTQARMSTIPDGYRWSGDDR